MRRTPLLNAALLLATSLCAFGAVEVVTRLWIEDVAGPDAPTDVAAWLEENIRRNDRIEEGPKQAFLKVMHGEFWNEGVQIHETAENPRLGYRLRPGATVDDVISINPQGFRGAPFTVEKPAGVRRIAVLGDSNGFGWWLRQEEVFTAVLEGLLDQDPRWRWQVYNFSVPGYCAAQEAELLRTEILAYQPDLVVVSYTFNDWSMGSDGGLLRRYAGTGSQALDLFYFRWLDHLQTGGTMSAIRLGYGEMAALSRAEHLPILIAFVPPRVDDGFGIEQLETDLALTREFGLDHIDLRPVFHPLDQDLVNLDGVHPSALGHRLIAESVRDWVLSRAGEWAQGDSAR